MRQDLLLSGPILYCAGSLSYLHTIVDAILYPVEALSGLGIST